MNVDFNRRIARSFLIFGWWLSDVKALGPAHRPRSLDGVVVLEVGTGDGGLGELHAAQAAINDRHLQNPVDHEGNGDGRVIIQRGGCEGFLP